MADREMRVKFTADTTQFNARVRAAGASVDQMGTRMDRMRGQLASVRPYAMAAAAGMAALSAAAGALGKSVIGVGNTVEQAGIRLKALFGSAAEGQKAFEALRATAAKLPFTFDEVLAAGTSLSVAVDNAEEMEKRMGQVAEISARFGIGLQEAATQFVRFSTAGAASADMFRERGVNAMLGIQMGAKTSAAESMRLWDEFFAHIDETGNRATTDLAQSWGGIVSMLQDKWFDFRAQVADAGFFDEVKGAAQGLLDKLNELAESGDLERMAKKTSDALIITFRAAVSGARTVANAFMAVGDSIFLALTTPLRAVLEILNKIRQGVNLIIQGLNKVKPGPDIATIPDIGLLEGLSERQGRALQNLQKHFKGTVDAAGSFSLAMRDAADEAEQLEEGGRNAGKGLDATGQAAKEAARALKEFTSEIPVSLGAARAQTAEFAADFETIANTLSANASPALRAFASDIQQAVNYQSQFNEELAEPVADGTLDKLYEGARRAQEEAGKLFENLVSAARAALDVVQAVSGISAELASALTSGINLFEAIKGLTSLKFDAGGLFSSFANFAQGIPGIGQAIGAAMNLGKKIVGALFGPSPLERESIAYEKRLRETLQRLSVDFAATERAAQQFHQQILQLRKGFKDVGPLAKGERPALVRDLQEKFAALGMSMEELAEVAKAAGIPIDQLLLVIKDGSGKIKLARDQWRALNERLGQMVPAAQRAAQAQAQLAAEEERLAAVAEAAAARLRRLEDSVSGTSMRIDFGLIDTLEEEFAALADVFASTLIGVPGRWEPIDFQSVDAINAAIAQIQDIIREVLLGPITAPGQPTLFPPFDLDTAEGQIFYDTLQRMFEILQTVKQQLTTTPDTGFAGGGFSGRASVPPIPSIPTPEMPQYLQGIAITEVQANELISVQRGIEFNTRRNADTSDAILDAITGGALTNTVGQQMADQLNTGP